MSQGTETGTSTPLQPEVHRHAPLVRLNDAWPGMRTRWIAEAPGERWTGTVLSEWELERAGWADWHPHDETNIVVAGELHVETAGTEVVLGPGDSVRVPAGQRGKYWAPEFARMVGIYGPNPTGATSEYIEYWDL